MKTKQKKQCITSIGILIFSWIGIVGVYGQSYNQSLLVNKEWKFQMPEKTFYFIHLFTEKEEVVKLLVDDIKTGDEIRSSYYLSDKIVDKFQPNSVGKSKKGKYIVVLRKGLIDGELLELYEIMELTEKTLKIKNLKNDSVTEFTSK